MKENDKALICTKGKLPKYRCASRKERKAKEFCKAWRMIVWGDGGIDGFKPVIGTYSTKAGKYYGVHVTCRFGDDYPDCGDFGKDM